MFGSKDSSEVAFWSEIKVIILLPDPHLIVDVNTNDNKTVKEI